VDSRGEPFVNKKKIELILIAAAMGIAVVIGVVTASNALNSSYIVLSNTSTAPTNLPARNSENNNSGEKSIIPIDKIVSGGPPKDGIPSIDKPKFVSVQDANKFLQDGDLVIGLNINGDVRAYPQQILVWHEIVNDKVGDIPVAVTYCPLCFTSQVFKRTLDGQIVVEFGTSGKLYNSNLVMYDRTSQSYWSQALGQGIVRKYAGTKLERVPFDLANWKDWKQLFPNSKVLSIDTGFGRPYGADPYGNYYTSPDIYFPVSHADSRLGVKEIVIGLENNGTYRAYKLDQIETNKAISDEIKGKSFTLFSLYPFMVRVYDNVIDGKLLTFAYDIKSGKIFDKQTGSEWNFDGDAIDGELKGKHLTRLPFDEGFWFEWVAFHPETEVYGG
jgi:hypothetical protein